MVLRRRQPASGRGSSSRRQPEVALALRIFAIRSHRSIRPIRRPLRRRPPPPRLTTGRASTRAQTTRSSTRAASLEARGAGASNAPASRNSDEPDRATRVKWSRAEPSAVQPRPSGTPALPRVIAGIDALRQPNPEAARTKSLGPPRRRLGSARPRPIRPTVAVELARFRGPPAPVPEERITQRAE